MTDICKRIQQNPDLVKLIKEQIQETLRDGMEHGFTICESDGYLKPGPLAEHEVGLSFEGVIETYYRPCPKREGRTAGIFHTHPGPAMNEFFSARDIVTSMKKGHDFVCVGLTNGTVMCVDLTRIPESTFDLIKGWEKVEIGCIFGDQEDCLKYHSMQELIKDELEKDGVLCKFKV